MNEIKTINFETLSSADMMGVEGGFAVTFSMIATGVALAAAGVTAGAAYKKYVVPKLESFGGKIYDWTH